MIFALLGKVIESLLYYFCIKRFLFSLVLKSRSDRLLLALTEVRFAKFPISRCSSFRELRARHPSDVMEPPAKPAAAAATEHRAHASAEVVQMIEATLIADDVIADSYDYARIKNKHHANEIVPSIKSLEANNKVITTPLTFKTWALTDEAEGYVQKGSPEAQIWNSVPAEGIDQKALIDRVPNGNIGFSQAMKNKVLQERNIFFITFFSIPHIT